MVAQNKLWRALKDVFTYTHICIYTHRHHARGCINIFAFGILFSFHVLGSEREHFHVFCFGNGCCSIFLILMLLPQKKYPPEHLWQHRLTTTVLKEIKKIKSKTKWYDDTWQSTWKIFVKITATTCNREELQALLNAVDCL